MRRRLIIVGVLCVLVGAAVAAANTLREPWLARQDLAALAAAALDAKADALTHLVFGERLAFVGRPGQALEEFQSAMRCLNAGQHDALAARIYARMAYAMVGEGVEASAEDYLQQARRIDPQLWSAYMAEGALLLRRRSVIQALAPLQKATAMRPGSFEANYLLGAALNENREPARAEAPLRRAVALAPHFAAAQAELGFAYSYQAKNDLATEHILTAHRLDPANREYLFAAGAGLGKLARSPERYRVAADILEECRRASPYDADLLYTLAQLHLRFMDLPKAHTLMRRAAELRPNRIQVWHNLQRIEELTGHPDSAARYQKIYEEKLMKHAAAILAARRVAARPRDAAARLALARAFRQENNIAGADYQLRTALALNPNFDAARREASGPLDEDAHGPNTTTSDAAVLGPPAPSELTERVSGRTTPRF